MTDLKATQGPYRATGPDPFGDFTIQPREEVSAVAAAVSNMRHRDEVKANAHLLAASWDMYHALEEAVDKIEDLKEVYSPHTEDVLTKARAALAKARGE